MPCNVECGCRDRRNNIAIPDVGEVIISRLAADVPIGGVASLRVNEVQTVEATCEHSRHATELGNLYYEAEGCVSFVSSS
jgi:hypothetical protein